LIAEAAQRHVQKPHGEIQFIPRRGKSLYSHRPQLFRRAFCRFPALLYRPFHPIDPVFIVHTSSSLQGKTSASHSSGNLRPPPASAPRHSRWHAPALPFPKGNGTISPEVFPYLPGPSETKGSLPPSPGQTVRTRLPPLLSV